MVHHCFMLKTSSLSPAILVFLSSYQKRSRSRYWFQWEVMNEKMILVFLWSTDCITHAGCWWRHRSWERDPAWYSWWRWDGPLAEAAEPARLFPETETGQPTLHSLDTTRQEDSISTKQETWLRLTKLLSNHKHQPWSEEINLQTSSTLHWAGVAERKLAPSSGRLPGAELSDGGALCPALEQECEELGDSERESSSSSSPSLDTSSERLDSEWHYSQKEWRFRYKSQVSCIWMPNKPHQALDIQAS